MTILLTTGEAAALMTTRLGRPVHRVAVWRMIEAGELSATRLRPGGWLYVARDAVLAKLPAEQVAA